MNANRLRENLCSAWRLIPSVEDIVPEKRLLVAIVERAVLDAAGKGLRPDEVSDDACSWRRDARSWIEESEDSEQWSFGWICEQLDICPARVRRILGMRELPRKGRKTDGFIRACLSPAETVSLMRIPG